MRVAGQGAALKWAGFDAIILQDKSDKPVYLVVKDGKVTFEDVSQLWGNDLFMTTRMLRYKYGDTRELTKLGPKGVQVYTIGPAGLAEEMGQEW